MFQPLHTGGLGLTSHQRSIDVIGNNVANIGTTGYKANRLDFQDTLYTRMFNKVNMGAEMNLERGTGLRTYQNTILFAQGAAQETGRTLDLMLEGQGFFVYENPEWDGETEGQQFLHSRNGNLYVTEMEGMSYLVDAQEHFILDENYERIALNIDPAALSVSFDGTLSFLGMDGESTPIAKLAVHDFVNPTGMTAAGGGYYMQTENSGDYIPADAEVWQGYTEASNVDLAEQMVRLIRSQRAYQIAARCVTTADQMMQVCNQIGR